MLKEQEESSKLEEKEEEITRLNNGKKDMNIDDEISKSFETIVHLKTQIEEAKRIEELLKIQINEKEDSCCKLEAEIVHLRKKVEKYNKFLNSHKSWMRSWKVKDRHVINQDLDTKKKLHMLKQAPQRSMR